MRLYKVRFIIASIVIAILYWIIEGFLHYFIFDFEGSLLEDLFYPIPHELYMRLVIFGFLILFGLYSQRISQKRAQEVTNTERERLYTLLDNLPAFVYLQADDHSIRYANRYFREKFGNLNNKKCFEVLHNFNQPCNKCQISSIFVNKTPVEEEWKNKRGEFYQFYHYPFRDSNQELLALSLGINITKLKKTEEILRESKERLRKSETMYKNLYKNVPIPTYTWQEQDGNLILIDFNVAGEKITKGTVKNFIGKKLSEFYVDRPEISNDIHRCLKDKINFSKEIVYSFKEIDLQRYLFVRYAYVPPNLVLVHTEDITEKKKAENLIKDELNKLKELDQIKNDLIRRISHEIKTPLISIYSTTNLLLEEYKEEFSSKIMDFITMINEGGERLNELVNNMLDVYNIESNNIKLNFTTQNLLDILEMSIRTLQSQIIKRQHKLEIISPQEVYMVVDYDRIKQVFLNLLTNALKYTPPRGKIFVQLQEVNSHVDITIKDFGVGFTEQEKEKIFKKFGKIERYGRGLNVDTEGAGFGLYIAKELTQLHNGELFLKSEGRNKGSTFIVRLFKENYK